MLFMLTMGVRRWAHPHYVQRKTAVCCDYCWARASLKFENGNVCTRCLFIFVVNPAGGQTGLRGGQEDSELLRKIISPFPCPAPPTYITDGSVGSSGLAPHSCPLLLYFPYLIDTHSLKAIGLFLSTVQD